ncbi:MAG: hypothetical protein Q8Q67_02805 [bacterium]|nr:hypothetical protein [bacterium]
MKIDYLPDLVPGQTIDLDKFNRPPRLETDKLQQLFKERLAVKSLEYNNQFGREWLNSDGSVKHFDHPDRAEDERLNAMQEEQWAKEMGKSVEEWRLAKERAPATLTEMALTILLQRLLPERFMIVRSSAYDDYNNGVDQLIIDKETGLVVCGIDEVIENVNKPGPGMKEEKVRNKMLNGGAEVKYGARVVEGELILGDIGRVPAFYISLSKSDLVKLGAALAEESPTDFEKALLRDVKASLQAQARSYGSLNLSRNLRKSLNTFTATLESWAT